MHRPSFICRIPTRHHKEMNVKLAAILLALSLALPTAVLAQHNHGADTPYAGMQERAIKSLSDADIKELRRRGGGVLHYLPNSMACRGRHICSS